MGWLLGGFLVSGVCFASAPSRGVLFSLLWALALLRWCGWVFCVRLVAHSLFGFVTELIIVKHRESPACFSGWQGFSVSWGCCFFLYGWVRVCFALVCGRVWRVVGLSGGTGVSRGVRLRLGVGLSVWVAGGLRFVTRVGRGCLMLVARASARVGGLVWSS